MSKGFVVGPKFEVRIKNKLEKPINLFEIDHKFK